MLLRTIIAVTAVAVGCLTGTLFAQSTEAQPPDAEAAAVETQPTDNSALATINWSAVSHFDSGYESSVAIHPSGLIVEVHSSGYWGYSGLWYHIGKLDPGSPTPITWGPSRQLVSGGSPGSWPSVAITKEGYVVIIWSNSFFKKDSVLKYSTGTIDLTGGTDQTINFKLKDVQFDTGFHNSIAVSYNGTITEVHESDGGKGIFYRIGHLTQPARNDFSITWTSGTQGVYYDNGINPHISVNDNNDVVEVHQVASDDHKLHYFRGKLSSRTLGFTPPAPRYNDDATSPTIVLLNNAYVVETHNSGSRSSFSAQYRTGLLDRDSFTKVNWSASSNIVNTRETTGLATNGTYLLATFGRAGSLYYAWAIAP